MKTWSDIKDAVEKNGNVLTVTMDQLKNAHGVERLGVHVRADISSSLAGMGLGHIPADLPNYQHEQVRLYKNGTPVGEFINTVLSPGQQNDNKLSDQFSGAKPDYAGIVQKIRDLVSE